MSDSPGADRRFATTRWSVVVAAGDSQHPDYRRALEELCTAYWHPVYAFVRRTGRSPDAAQDLTQGFFSHLLQRHTLKAADRELGRFRSFLLTALKFHLSNERQRERDLKRDATSLRAPSSTARCISSKSPSAEPLRNRPVRFDRYGAHVDISRRDRVRPLRRRARTREVWLPTSRRCSPRQGSRS